MEPSQKLDRLLSLSSLEHLAEIYTKIPEKKQQEVSSRFGGHQQPEFYQGIVAYMRAVAISLEEHSCKDLAESASMMACTIANGLLYEDFGQKQKTVACSLFDDSMDENQLKKALQTPIPSFFLEKVEDLYENSQPLAFYNGMFRAAVLVFSTAYKQQKVKNEILDDLIWNYAFLGRIISKKRRQN